jgi:hypothetical protein
MDSTDPRQTPSNAKPSFLKRFFRIAVPVLIVLLCGSLFIVRWLGQRDLRIERDRSLTELKGYEAKATKRCSEIQSGDMSLFGLPLAWAVRRELMHGNYDQIDEYFSELVRIRGFSLIMLVEPDGLIKIATDRKLQGTPYSVLYPGMDIGVQRPVSYGLRDGSTLFVLPVMGLSDRLGTIAFVYSFKPLQLSAKESK